MLYLIWVVHTRRKAKALMLFWLKFIQVQKLSSALFTKGR